MHKRLDLSQGAKIKRQMPPFPLSLLLCVVCFPSISNAASRVSNIFLLAGQSNMSGRGGVVNDTWDGYVPPECVPNSSILRLNAELEWVEAVEPLHKDIDVNKTCGVGAGMSFANALLAKSTSIGVIGLVPCAIGGTKISEWAQGTELYNQLIRRAGAAVQGGTLSGLLWYQGESDTVLLRDAELYKTRLAHFFVNLRADLASPFLPIVQVALASGQGHYIEMVRQAQLGLDMANVKCVDAKGLPLEPDGLHLTTPAQVQLGEMLADSFLQSPSGPVQSSSNAPQKLTNFVSVVICYFVILQYIELV